MKIAINRYASFENSEFDHILRMDDVFVVTPEFEENPAFIEGLRVGAFEFVEIENIGQLKKVIGVTDEMIEEFWDSLVAEEIAEEVVEEAIPETVPEVVEPKPEPEEQPKEEEIKEKPPVEEKVEEKVAEEPPKDEKPVLAFTEIAGKLDNALKAISKETNKDKLNFALKQDERVTVKKAIVVRLKEL